MARIGIQVNSAPPAEQFDYVAGALCELLRVGAECRTSESVLMSAINALSNAVATAPVALHGAQVDNGDQPRTLVA